MCGICGIWNHPEAAALVRSSLKMLHGRGKDGDHIASVKKGALGHRLHAVVGHVTQPFEGKGVLSTNCEIYNWKELAKKYQLQPKNDAQLLFLLLEQTKPADIPKLLDQLDGDYALIYQRENLVWCARDPIGVKPIFYSLEKGFSCASERKMLRESGFSAVFELHPRHVLCYNAASKKITRHVRSFPSVAKTIKKPVLDLKKAFLKAVEKRIPEGKCGILFSGGIDSTLVAMASKHLNANVHLYTTIIEGTGIPEAKDLAQSEVVAQELELPHTIVRVSFRELVEQLPTIIKTIESTEVTKVGAAIPVFFAARAAEKDGIRVMFSGGGSDDIMGGYARQRDTASLRSDCISNARKIFERDTFRDDSATMFHNIETRFPFLDKEVIECALGIPPEIKRAEGNKSLLKDLGKSLGWKNDKLYAKKSAAQYGSRADHALSTLAKMQGFGERKGAYLYSLAKHSNGRLAALVSGGKDSLLAMHIMQRKFFEISCLITLESTNPDSYMFHTPAIEMVRLQAKALGIPLIRVKTTGEKEAELKDLARGILQSQKKHAIEGVVVGAIASTYQRDRVDLIAEETGVKVYAPLWHKDQELVLRELLDNEFEFVLTKTAAEGLNQEWLGRIITRADVEELKRLQEKYKINIAGEGGEYESLVLDMPLFTKKIVLKKTSIQNDGSALILAIQQSQLSTKH